jgi:hypothetical protein
MNFTNIYFNVKRTCGLIFILLLLQTTGCKKFIKIPPPDNQLVPASVFNNDASATAALVSIYGNMQMSSNSFFMTYQPGLLADELTNYSSDAEVISYYQNGMTANTSAFYFGPWMSAYPYIFQLNSILEGLEQINGVSSPVKGQLMGESKFLRAFWYFYLTNCYGDIPLATTTEYKTNAKLSKSTQAEVYKVIVQDLKEASELMNENFIDASDTTVTTERTRPNKWAALGLLARIYLYTGRYVDAESIASLVIDNSNLFSLQNDLNAVFLKNSSEAIWQLAVPLPTGINTQEGNSFILTGAPRSFGNGLSCALSDRLLNSFEINDNRKASWVGTFTTSDSITYYFPDKYKIDGVHTDPNNIQEYTMVLRLAELYLIRAEARVFTEDFEGAILDLNIIRSRAGLPNYAGNIDAPSLKRAILHERQVELFAEWGHRWFDLIRTNTIDEVMGAPSNVTQLKGGTWEPYKKLYPIPFSEIQSNANLSQNIGY